MSSPVNASNIAAGQQSHSAAGGQPDAGGQHAGHQGEQHSPAEPSAAGHDSNRLGGPPRLASGEAQVNQSANQPGELFTHTLRSATDEERRTAKEDAHLAATQQQQQRAFGIDAMTRLGLEQELRPLVTWQLFEGGTPSEQERRAFIDLLIANPTPANLVELQRWTDSYSLVIDGYRIDARPHQFTFWTRLSTGETSCFPPPWD